MIMVEVEAGGCSQASGLLHLLNLVRIRNKVQRGLWQKPSARTKGIL